jgi:hypothetical protein
MDEKDPTRAFVDRKSGKSTDCFCLIDEEGGVRSWTNNPLGGLVCLPWSTLGHLCLFPCMCCFSTQERWQQMQGGEEHCGVFQDYALTTEIGDHKTLTVYSFK